MCATVLPTGSSTLRFVRIPVPAVPFAPGLGPDYRAASSRDARPDSRCPGAGVCYIVMIEPACENRHGKGLRCPAIRRRASSEPRRVRRPRAERVWITMRRYSPEMRRFRACLAAGMGTGTVSSMAGGFSTCPATQSAAGQVLPRSLCERRHVTQRCHASPTGPQIYAATPRSACPKPRRRPRELRRPRPPSGDRA